jgi:Rad3-related DNA helicase
MTGIASAVGCEAAASDLLKATRLLAAARAALEFGETLISRSSFAQAGDLLTLDLELRRLVEADLKRLMQKARAIIGSNHDRVRNLSKMLLDRRFLAGEDLEGLSTSLAVERAAVLRNLPHGAREVV